MAMKKKKRKLKKNTEIEIEMEIGGHNVGHNKREFETLVAAAEAAEATERLVEVKKKALKRRSKGGPGIRLVGGRIYDSEGGKTCHQCRQKTRDLTAECKNIKKEKQCPLRYCHKCLLNRYGENVEAAAALEDWLCPKCRDICNCSFCMKKKGHKPTGMLTHTAKATGFSSVSQMLQTQGPENVLRIKDASGKLDSPKKATNDGYVSTSDTSSGSELLPTTEPGSSQNDIDAPGVESRKEAENDTKEGATCNKFKKEDVHPDITLPQGIKITDIAGVELQQEDVGNVLQFFEFCATFGEILGLKKGQAESLIRDIMDGGDMQRGKYSTVVEFQILLLTLLQKDWGEESPSLSPGEGENHWLKALRNFLYESECKLKHLMIFMEQGNNGYDMMDPSHKLKLLIFLCEETLGTMEIRNWIEDQHIKFADKEKEVRGQAIAAKGKEKTMKQKLEAEFAKAVLAKNGAPLTISEHEAIVSEIKAKAAKAHDDMVETGSLIPKRKQQSDAVRTEPLIRDGKGRVCWRLKGYNSQIVLLDLVTSKEKWFSYNEEEEQSIEKLLSLFRVKRQRRNRVVEQPPVETGDPGSIASPSSKAEDFPPPESANEGCCSNSQPTENLSLAAVHRVNRKDISGSAQFLSH